MESIVALFNFIGRGWIKTPVVVIQEECGIRNGDPDPGARLQHAEAFTKQERSIVLAVKVLQGVFSVDELNAVVHKGQALSKIQGEITLRVHIDVYPILEDLASAAQMKFLARLTQKPHITVKSMGEENVQPGTDKEFEL